MVKAFDAEDVKEHVTTLFGEGKKKFVAAAKYIKGWIVFWHGGISETNVGLEVHKACGLIQKTGAVECHNTEVTGEGKAEVKIWKGWVPLLKKV